MMMIVTDVCLAELRAALSLMDLRLAYLLEQQRWDDHWDWWKVHRSAVLTQMVRH